MKRIDVYVTDRQYLFLSMTESKSEHIRRALDEYIEKQKRKVGISASVTKGGENGA